MPDDEEVEKPKNQAFRTVWGVLILQPNGISYFDPDRPEKDTTVKMRLKKKYR